MSGCNPRVRNVGSSGRLTEINLSAPGASALTLPKKIFVDKFLVKLGGWHDTAGVGREGGAVDRATVFVSHLKSKVGS